MKPKNLVEAKERLAHRELKQEGNEYRSEEHPEGRGRKACRAGSQPGDAVTLDDMIARAVKAYQAGHVLEA